jgi:2-keto-4-pentenoate hydratase/2-oxohepta-3-ene-1,7-dioic acid hydratase in catechol pathway
MKFASFNGGRVGLVDGEEIVDLSGLVGPSALSWPPVGMVQLIAQFDALKTRLEGLAKDGPHEPLANVRLETPIAWPNKIVAFPANYHGHIDEMKERGGMISRAAASGQGFFLKSNSSLSGPSDPIVLPAISNREIHHEMELAIVIGRGGHAISEEQALDHIFGYACLLDMVIRGKEERVMRKSFDTFCPVGPYIVTSDEVGDPSNIDLTLTVNGALRQSANTRDLIVGVRQMIVMASSVMTLQPGDIIASGTPAGVGPVDAGDVVEISISRVGQMRLQVIRSEVGDHPVWHQQG